MNMIDLLTDAQHEINGLRRENEILRAKVETMDLFACALRTRPDFGMRGEGIDVAWRIGQEVERLKAEEEAAKAKDSSGTAAE